MLTSFARMSLFRDLRARMHPGYAYLVTVACYPRRHRPPAVIPVVDEVEAFELTEAWRRDPGPERDLVRALYGDQQDDAIRDFLRRGREFR